jgi:hypothetical protein
VRARFFFPAIVIALVFLIARASAAPLEDPLPDPAPVEVTVQGKTAAQWHTIAARYRQQLLRRWRPTVEYAAHLAAAVYGVSEWEIRAVGYCESHHYVFARNGRYKGWLQLGWRPFGLSPFDPVASALSAAATVRHDGSWRQWQCRP